MQRLQEPNRINADVRQNEMHTDESVQRETIAFKVEIAIQVLESFISSHNKRENGSSNYGGTTLLSVYIKGYSASFSKYQLHMWKKYLWIINVCSEVLDTDELTFNHSIFL